MSPRLKSLRAQYVINTNLGLNLHLYTTRYARYWVPTLGKPALCRLALDISTT